MAVCARNVCIESALAVWRAIYPRPRHKTSANRCARDVTYHRIEKTSRKTVGRWIGAAQTSADRTIRDRSASPSLQQEQSAKTVTQSTRFKGANPCLQVHLTNVRGRMLRHGRRHSGTRGQQTYYVNARHCCWCSRGREFARSHPPRADL